MQNPWTPEYQRFPERLNQAIMVGPLVARPDPPWIFYIKIDWSKDVIGEVLLQEDGSAEARKVEAQEKSGEKCEFDKFLK